MATAATSERVVVEELTTYDNTSVVTGAGIDRARSLRAMLDNKALVVGSVKIWQQEAKWTGEKTWVDLQQRRSAVQQRQAK